MKETRRPGSPAETTNKPTSLMAESRFAPKMKKFRKSLLQNRPSKTKHKTMFTYRTVEEVTASVDPSSVKYLQQRKEKRKEGGSLSSELAGIGSRDRSWQQRQESRTQARVQHQRGWRETTTCFRCGIYFVFCNRRRKVDCWGDSARFGITFTIGAKKRKVTRPEKAESHKSSISATIPPSASPAGG